MKIIIYLVAILLLRAPALYAHPHLFVDSIATLEQEKGDQYKISILWIFDQWHSQGLIIDFDMDVNGKLDKKESRDLLKGLTGNLKQYHHFAKLKLNGKKAEGKTSNYKIVAKTIEIKGEDGKKEKVPVFHYMYEYHFKSSGPLKSLDLEFYDDTLYSAIASRGNMKLGKGLKAVKNSTKKDLCHYTLEF